jgi:trehalose 6-phosphate synthase
MKAGRLVVVSNRVATGGDVKPGGLAMAMQAALRDHGGVWFGWNGTIAPDDCWTLHRERSGPVEYVTMGLNRQDHDDYYAGYANRALWPLLHFRPSLVNHTRAGLAGYLRVNALMADRLAALLEPDDIVWIHDYHLMPLAGMLRERGVGNRIGFFLHTPLPPRELLVMLPDHPQVFGALTACDLIGFQTEDDAAAFRGYIEAEKIGARRPFRAATFPIGIDTPFVEAQAARSASSAPVRALRGSLAGRSLIVGVDRLDYSKGLPERFNAYGHLLRTCPEIRRSVSLLQIAPPSRGEVQEYRAVRRELERIAGHVNGEFADADWVPIRYLNKSFPHAVLTGYYRSARVGLVTPLRDGMNLVAKEYLAAQDPADPGVLVLSRFAGAARELESALLVNPHDVESMAEAMRAALAMPLDERQQRWERAMRTLRANDIACWRRTFLTELLGSPAATKGERMLAA